MIVALADTIRAVTSSTFIGGSSPGYVPDMSDGFYLRRVLWLIAIWVIVELVLFAIAYFGPAFATLMRSAYVIVAIFFGIAIARARPRSGEDRRHADRRQHSSPSEDQTSR